MTSFSPELILRLQKHLWNRYGIPIANDKAVDQLYVLGDFFLSFANTTSKPVDAGCAGGNGLPSSKAPTHPP